MVGPIIAEFGSDEQKHKFLPAPADSRASRCLLLDLTTPGIERRPIRLVDGSAEVNEFFFDDVQIPAENLVGEENVGWTYAKYLLGDERNSIAQVGTAQRIFVDLAASAATTPVADGTVAGGMLADDVAFRTAMHNTKTKLLALEATQLRVTGASENGAASPVSSLLKLEGTRALQELTRLRMTAAGSDAALVHTAGPLIAEDDPRALVHPRAPDRLRTRRKGSPP